MRRIPVMILAFLLASLRMAAGQPLPQDARIQTGECENGLRYIVARHAMPPLRAQVWLQIDAGSLNETAAQRGAANFIAHLAPDGSENYPPEAAKQLIDSLGKMTSSTSFNESVYRFDLRDATPENIGRALAFLRDVANGLTFPGAEVEKERTAILEEQKKTANVEQRVQEFLLAQIAPGSIIGDRPRAGTPASVAALGVDDLRAFYRRWYVPSNMTVIFAGDADPGQVIQAIKGTVGAGPRVPRPAGPELGVKPMSESRAAVISDGELKGARVYFLRPGPLQPPVTTVEDLRRRVTDSVAVGAFNRRLGTKIQSGKFPFEEGGSFSSDLTGICQLSGVYVASDARSWQDALKALGTEVQRARLHGLFASEIDETKKQFLAQAEQNVANEAVRQGVAYAQALSAAAGNGDVLMSAQDTLEQLKGILGSLDEKAVSDSFAKVMDPSDVLYMVALPSTGEVPKESDLLAAGNSAMSVSPEAESEYVMPKALMPERPAPAKVVEEHMHDASGVWSGWLDNGVLVHHRRMDVSKGQATVTVAVAGGLIEETELTRGLTEAGSVAWSRPATSKLPSYVIQELTKDKIKYQADDKDPKKLRLGGGPGVDNLLLAVSGPVENLETGMQLLHLLLTDPVIEAPALDQWRKTQIEAADGRAKQARSVFNDAMIDMVYPPGELRPRPLTREQVERVKLEAAQAWFHQRLAAGPIEVSVVGDITREQAVDLVATYIGSLPTRDRISSTTFDSLRQIEHVKGPQVVKREVEGMTDTSFIMAGFLGTDADKVADARLLGVAAQVLQTRLSQTVQTKEQLLTNILVQSQPAQEFPGFGVFGVYAPAQADKAEPAVKRIFEVLDEFRDNGPTVEELAAAKQQVSLQLESALADPGFWSGQLSLLEYRGAKLDDLAGALDPYKAMTPDEVKNAFAKYDLPDRRMQLILVQKVDPDKVTQVKPPMKIPAPAAVGPENPRK
jgi:zinc protease